jgi:hypothetical protein
VFEIIDDLEKDEWQELQREVSMQRAAIIDYRTVTYDLIYDA